jgi:periplasmic protein CpxP/Spy
MKVRMHMIKAVLLAITATAWLAGPAQAMGPHGHGGEGGHHMGLQMGERMLDGVNATAEQKAQIRKIMETARQDMQAGRQGAQQLRQRSMEALAQPNIDANAVEALRMQMVAHHDQTSRRMTQAMIEAAKVLTPEQRKQLAERLGKRGDMMQRHHKEREALDKPKS